MKRKLSIDEGKQPTRKKQKVYEFGNYHRYYGYRAPNQDDPRVLSMNKEWFNDKAVLDIGCNAGNILLWIVSNCSPWRALGIDLDGRLIGRARKKLIKLAEQISEEKKTSDDDNLTETEEKTEDTNSKQEIVNLDHQFPNNTTFKTANFITYQFRYQKFDVILCLSVSKWIHLNWGDKGIMDLFKKAYNMLEPGGKFILEPQQWSSYKKKKNITETIKENFSSLKIKPEQFTDILLSEEVGFSRCEELNINYPEDFHKGFSIRPIFIYYK